MGIGRQEYTFSGYVLSFIQTVVAAIFTVVLCEVGSHRLCWKVKHCQQQLNFDGLSTNGSFNKYSTAVKVVHFV